MDTKEKENPTNPTVSVQKVTHEVPITNFKSLATILPDVFQRPTPKFCISTLAPGRWGKVLLAGRQKFVYEARFEIREVRDAKESAAVVLEPMKSVDILIRFERKHRKHKSPSKAALSLMLPGFTQKQILVDWQKRGGSAIGAPKTFDFIRSQLTIPDTVSNFDFVMGILSSQSKVNVDVASIHDDLSAFIPGDTLVKYNVWASTKIGIGALPFVIHGIISLYIGTLVDFDFDNGYRRIIHWVWDHERY